MTHNILKNKLEHLGKGNVSDSKILKMIDLFHSQLQLSGDKGIVKYYERALNIPYTTTQAVLKESYGGLSPRGSHIFIIDLIHIMSLGYPLIRSW